MGTKRTCFETIWEARSTPRKLWRAQKSEFGPKLHGQTVLLGDFFKKMGLRPIIPKIVGRCYLYATLPCPPYRTGPTYATGPHSARVNALGTPRFARDGHCLPARPTRLAALGNPENGSKPGGKWVSKTGGKAVSLNVGQAIYFNQKLNPKQPKKLPRPHNQPKKHAHTCARTHTHARAHAHAHALTHTHTHTHPGTH